MIYLNNAATTFPKPQSVIDSIINVTLNGAITYGRGTGLDNACESIPEVRKAVAKFFGVLEDYRVIFTCSATDSLNMAIKGFLEKGSHVVISAIEHNSVLRPLKSLEQQGFITLDIVLCDKKGYIDIDDLKRNVSDKTKLVVISHASNVTGAVQDIDKIGEIVRSYGAYLLVDAAQTAGVIPIDMSLSPIDMLAFSCHKGLYAAQGTGALILGERITKLKPFREGGTGFDSKSEYQPINWPEAFESGTPNTTGIISLGAGLKFIKDVGIDNIAKVENKHFERLWSGLSKLENVELYGPTINDKRVSVLSFNIKGWESADVGAILEQNHNISIRAGLQCSRLAHITIGTFPDGTVRVSPGYFNNETELDIFIQAVQMIASTDVPMY